MNRIRIIQSGKGPKDFVVDLPNIPKTGEMLSFIDCETFGEVERYEVLSVVHVCLKHPRPSEDGIGGLLTFGADRIHTSPVEIQINVKKNQIKSK